jgi:hypothetical protein
MTNQVHRIRALNDDLRHHLIGGSGVATMVSKPTMVRNFFI